MIKRQISESNVYLLLNGILTGEIDKTPSVISLETVLWCASRGYIIVNPIHATPDFIEYQLSKQGVRKLHKLVKALSPRPAVTH